MASYETIFATISGRFQTQVETPQSLTGKVQYDNDGRFVKPDGEVWTRVTIKGAGSSQIAFGSTAAANIDRFRGVLLIQIFGPVGVGDRAILQLADVIEAAFNKVTDGTVVFGVPDIVPVGRRGSEHQVNVECPFYADR